VVVSFVLYVQASCAKGAWQVKVDGRMSGGTPFVSNVGCEQNVYFIDRVCVRGCVQKSRASKFECTCQLVIMINHSDCSKTR